MYSDVQLAAIETAKALLLGAGLQPAANLTSQPTNQPSSPASPFKDTEQAPPHLLHLRYQPPIARPFTKDELALNLHIINRQLRADAFVDHPLDAVVEYPESSSEKWPHHVIAHRFAVDPTKSRYYHPKSNVQYSMGGSHGAEDGVYCGTLLCDIDGKAVVCQKVKTSCKHVFYHPQATLTMLVGKGLKYCEHYDASWASRTISSTISAQEQVFMKTLGFFCAVSDARCAIDLNNELSVDYRHADDDLPISMATDPKLELGPCEGKLIIAYDQHNRACLR